MAKFNKKTKTKSWFPITQHRFKTDKHPVVTDKSKCSAGIQFILSWNERQMLDGLMNIVQQSERDTIRIALSEAAQTPVEELLVHAECASRVSTKTGHTGRERKVSARLTKSEKDSVDELSSALELTVKETVRLTLIWLAKGIRDDSIKSLQFSRKIPQDQLARQWRDENQGHVGVLGALKTAHKESYDEAQQRGWEHDQELYRARGEMMDYLKFTDDPTAGIIYNTDDDDPDQTYLNYVDAQLEMRANEELKEFLNQKHHASREEAMAIHYEVNMGFDEVTAAEMAAEFVKLEKEKEAEKEELMSSQEDILADLPFPIENHMKPQPESPRVRLKFHDHTRDRLERFPLDVLAKQAKEQRERDERSKQLRAESKRREQQRRWIMDTKDGYILPQGMDPHEVYGEFYGTPIDE